MPTRVLNDLKIIEGNSRIAEQIDKKLLSSLRATLPQSANEAMVLAAYTPDDSLAGGLTAGTSYGWLLIKTLWVSESCRQCGIGRQLMAAAESRGLKLGCHSAWLDTSNPLAMRFYQKLGYELFGVLANSSLQAPAGHQRWFMKKDLIA